MDESADIHRIKELERMSSQLEFDPGQRSALVKAVLSYSESLIENLKQAPAYKLPTDDGL
jgi:hypothetical protein